MEDCAAEDPKSLITKKRKPEEVALAGNHVNSIGVGESTVSVDLCHILASGSSNSNNPCTSYSDLSCQDDDNQNGDDNDEDPDYASDYYDNDDFIYDDEYDSMQTHFDNVDLPPGVEISLPWLKDLPSSETTPAFANTSILTISDLPECKKDAAASSSSAVAESSSKKIEEDSDDAIMQTFREFKQFDTVDDFSDHHYNHTDSSEKKPSKNWAKKIQDEWKILEQNLPDTIFVRVYEARMDLLRAVIIGPSGTPYHDGLFVFDCLFPSTYPDKPPMVYYYSGGLRLNPNLYDTGKVCLSLLGTWSGKEQTEKWIPNKSTMLQVLVSIQALILNEQPFFNEPGYDTMYVGAEGQKRSKEYNESTFILSLKTMMYTLRKPPKHFENFVVGHFRSRAFDILWACRAYAQGTPVGSAVRDLPQDEAMNGDEGKNKEFQSAVSRMMNTLVAFFTKNGSTDVDEFRILP
ncbi:Ubiquitin-conjugating enzyme like [Quillaja saponaria]|uniref:E2 ubiquitin-conjugating enzyme n=1 Tax=Quillaja saponaria TaxID=32244 RepID=A0AAD7KYQ1_QUISA|nr:Ubiquitin-conjugating enzyme like [Quillaja saponaria]